MGNHINGVAGQVVQISGNYSGDVDMTGDGIQLRSGARVQSDVVAVPAELLNRLGHFLGDVATAGHGLLSDTAAQLAEEIQAARGR